MGTDKGHALLELLKQPSRIHRKAQKLINNYYLLSEQMKLDLIQDESAPTLESIGNMIYELKCKQYEAVCNANDAICLLSDEPMEESAEKAVLMSFYIGRRSIKRIAEEMGIAESSVYRTKARGLKRLARLMPEVMADNYSA